MGYMMTALLSAASLQSDLQAIVDTVAKKYNCSVSLGIRMPNDVKYSAAGGLVSEGTYPVAAQTSDRYAWGSVTKTMTGAAIMKRVAAGELSLDSVAHTFVDAMLKSAKYPYDMSGLFSADKWSIPPEHQYDPKKVTIEQLLHMVSGVPDYDTDAYRHLQYTHASTGFSPLDILDYVHAPLMFQPGGPVPSGGSHHSSTNYCSVNFILLGLVLAEKTGASSWDAYDQGEILPLPLRERVHFASLTDLCGNVTAPVHGYDRQSYATSEGKQPFDVSSINCLAGWTAGNVIMDAQAAADWTFALYGPDEEVIPASAVQQMVNASLNGSYGLALFNFDKRWTNGTRATSYGHLGDTYGFTSIIAYFPSDKVGMAVATNLEQGQTMPSETVCLAINRVLDDIDGRLVPRKCVYASSSYYGGACQCEE